MEKQSTPLKLCYDKDVTSILELALISMAPAASPAVCSALWPGVLGLSETQDYEIQSLMLEA